MYRNIKTPDELKKYLEFEEQFVAFLTTAKLVGWTVEEKKYSTHCPSYELEKDDSSYSKQLMKWF